MLGKKLIINDRMEIDLTQEVDPIILECLNACEVELKKEDGQDAFEVIYTPTADTKFFKGEGDEQDIIYLNGEKFDDIFHQVLMLLIEEAIKQGHLLEGELGEEFEANPEAVLFEEPAPAVQPPSILEQFANGCTYYFNEACNAIFPKNQETETAQEQDKSAFRPTNH